MKSVCLFILLCFLLASPIICAGSPFDDFFNPPVPPGEEDTPPDIPVDTNTIPFLQAFLIVYEDQEWIFVSNDGPCAKISIYAEPAICDVNATECCGSWIARGMDTEDVLAEGLFCLESTWRIILRDNAREWGIQCVGMRGGKMENPLHPTLGYAIDDPALLDCGSFRLIRPE